jgi:predicted transcriptional regulator
VTPRTVRSRIRSGRGRVPPPSASSLPPRGLGVLRRGGSLSDLLFLYECATRDVAHLRTAAEALGLTVQAVSHTFRGLARRRLVELANGRYRPTIEGIDFLHGHLDDLSSDLSRRLEKLHIVRTTHAIAGAAINAGAEVALNLEDGLLTARPNGDGPARGMAVSAARKGGLVEVSRLEGIVPLAPATVIVRTLADRDLADPALGRRLVRALRSQPGVLAALGVEPFALLRAAGFDSVLRFAVAESARDASRMGVPVTVVVLERDLPRLLASFAADGAPPLAVASLGRGAGPRDRGLSRRPAPPE